MMTCGCNFFTMNREKKDVDKNIYYVDEYITFGFYLRDI